MSPWVHQESLNVSFALSWGPPPAPCNFCREKIFGVLWMVLFTLRDCLSRRRWLCRRCGWRGWGSSRWLCCSAPHQGRPSPGSSQSPGKGGDEDKNTFHFKSGLNRWRDVKIRKNMMEMVTLQTCGRRALVAVSKWSSDKAGLPVAKLCGHNSWCYHSQNSWC